MAAPFFFPATCYDAPVPGSGVTVRIVSSVLGVCLAMATLEVHPLEGQTPSEPGLAIVVIAGQDAINILQPPRAVTPVVEVRDSSGRPVAGAAVTFVVQTGSGADGIRMRFSETDAAGRAQPIALSPTSPGPIEIQVTATFQGQRVTATITQMTWATLDSRDGVVSRTAAPVERGPSRVSSRWLWTSIAGSAAGLVSGLYLAHRNSAPAPGVITFSPTSGGMVSRTTFTFAMDGATDADGDALVYAWNFGDGGRSTGQTVTHVFTTPGTYTVNVNVQDPQSSSTADSTVVVLPGLAGTWTAFQDPLTNCTVRPRFFQATPGLIGGLVISSPCVVLDGEGGVSLQTLAVGTAYPASVAWDTGSFSYVVGSGPTQTMRMTFAGTTGATGTEISGVVTSIPNVGASATAAVSFGR